MSGLELNVNAGGKINVKHGKFVYTDVHVAEEGMIDATGQGYKSTIPGQLFPLIIHFNIIFMSMLKLK